jgi:EF-P beta-lysylation protein EpmB
MQWRKIQRTNFTKIDELLDYLSIPKEQWSLFSHTPRFVLNLPRRLAAKIEKNNLSDPLLRQFVPLRQEQELTPGFQLDPVLDTTFQKTAKTLHKYNSRALIITTSACAMHCRYCFRQNFPYDTANKGFSDSLAYIRSTPSIQEVILSGGDPLSLSDRDLDSLLKQLEEVSHLKRIRYHTRFPIGIPERIDDSLLQILASSSKQQIFIVHINHPRELDSDVLASLKAIQKLGIPLLNQSVLLKGVNDNEETLLALCEELISGGILPYYLHLLDPVAGAAHFEVSEERGQALIDHVQRNLSGFGVPRLVREIPGEPSKSFVAHKSE